MGWAPAHILGSIARARREQRNRDVAAGMLEFVPGDSLSVRKIEYIHHGSYPYLCIVLANRGQRTTVYSIDGFVTRTPAFPEEYLAKFRFVYAMLLRQIIETVDDPRTVRRAEKQLAQVCVEATA